MIYANASHYNVTELVKIITGISSEINNIEQNCQKKTVDEAAELMVINKYANYQGNFSVQL
jgi:hypothetical protein